MKKIEILTLYCNQKMNKIANILEMANRIAKRSEIWYSMYWENIYGIHLIL